MKILIAAVTAVLLGASNLALAHNFQDRNNDHRHKRDNHRMENHRIKHHHIHYRTVCKHSSHRHQPRELTRREAFIANGLLAPIAIHHALHDHHKKAKQHSMAKRYKNQYKDHHNEGRRHK